MKVLIGVDPHKTSVAVAAVDEATGELLERASFTQDRAGLSALERWARRFPERRWALENAGGLGRHLAGRLAAAGESVVDVPPKLSARVRVLSLRETPVRTTGSMPSRSPWRPRATKDLRRSIRRPPPRCCACSPRGAYGPGRRAHQGAQGSLHALLRDGVAGKLSADRAARILRGIRPKGGASLRLRRGLASEVLRDVRTLDRKIAELSGRIEAEVEASGTTLT